MRPADHLISVYAALPSEQQKLAALFILNQIFKAPRVSCDLIDQNILGNGLFSEVVNHDK